MINKDRSKNMETQDYSPIRAIKKVYLFLFAEKNFPPTYT
ncbi:hypothetical protein BH11BAC7_BH11BAC7_26340 [soil metagenome]